MFKKLKVLVEALADGDSVSLAELSDEYSKAS